MNELKAALIETRAKLSGAEALIEHLQLGSIHPELPSSISQAIAASATCLARLKPVAGVKGDCSIVRGGVAGVAQGANISPLTVERSVEPLWYSESAIHEKEICARVRYIPAYTHFTHHEAEFYEVIFDVG